MYLQLLKDGKKITVSDKQGNYTATTFYFGDGVINYINAEIGKGKHSNFTKNNKLFNKHITNMIQQDFQIIIE